MNRGPRDRIGEFKKPRKVKRVTKVDLSRMTGRRVGDSLDREFGTRGLVDVSFRELYSNRRNK